jgi:hypothetical protein
MAAFARQWYVVAAGLLVTIALAFGATKLTPLKYQAEATVVLLPSSHSSGAAGDNPYLTVGDGLKITVSVLSKSMADDKTAETLAARGATGSFSVALDLASPGPVAAVTATDRTPAGAVKTLQLVEDELQTQLRKLQLDVGAPQNQLVTADTVSSNDKAKPMLKSLLRGVIALVAIGLAGTYLTVRWIDNRRGRRPKRVIAPDEAPAPVMAIASAAVRNAEPRPTSLGRNVGA